MIEPANDAIAELLRGRRTIHNFQAEPVPQALLLQALELARWAPNHHLTEPWRFYLPGPATIAEIIDLNCRLVAAQKGAAAADNKRRRWASMPGWLVLTSQRSDKPVCQQEDYAACCCAVQNMQLYLASKGVGVKWSTGTVTREAAFYQILGADPEQEQVVGLFWYGYPVLTPPRRRNKDVAEITIELP